MTPPPSAGWAPNVYKGTITKDTRLARDGHLLDIAGIASGAPAIVDLSFSLPAESSKAAVKRGDDRYADHCQSVRVAVAASPEAHDYQTIGQALATMIAKRATLTPQAAEAERNRDALLASDDDAEYSRRDGVARSLRNRHDRLGTEQKELEAKLKSLEAPLIVAARQIATRAAIAAENEATAALHNFCGVFSGVPLAEALTQIIELNQFRLRVSNEGKVHLGEQIAGEIIGTHRHVTAPGPNAFARPTVQPVAV